MSIHIQNALSLCAPAGDEKIHSLVVHTTVPFGLDNINCNVNSICYNVVLSRLHQLLPRLPTSLSVEPHKWQYSQVCFVALFNFLYLFSSYDFSPELHVVSVRSFQIQHIMLVAPNLEECSIFHFATSYHIR